MTTHSAECYRWHHACAVAEVERLRAALAEPVQEPVRLQCVTCGTVYADGVPPQVPPQVPVQEPVAWYFEARHIDSAWAAAVTLKHPGPEGKYMRKVTPLYTAPPQRKPLTEEEIDKVSRRWVPVAAYMGLHEHAEMTQKQAQQSIRSFARAIEKAHGIE